MQVTAGIDYAVRALLELASSEAGRVTRDELADAQDTPRRYLESILLQLRREGLVIGQRGATGGYRLVGDTSYGEGCAQPGKPGVYGRIAEGPLRDWIKGQVPAAYAG